MAQRGKGEGSNVRRGFPDGSSAGGYPKKRPDPQVDPSVGGDPASSAAYRYGGNQSLKELFREMQAAGLGDNLYGPGFNQGQGPTSDNEFDYQMGWREGSPLDFALNQGVRQASDAGGRNMAQQSRGSFQDGIRLEALMRKLQGEASGGMPGR